MSPPPCHGTIRLRRRSRGKAGRAPPRLRSESEPGRLLDMDELPTALALAHPGSPAEVPIAEETSREAARIQSREEDQALIAALKQGDGEAFRALVLKYERQVYNHCLRMVYDEEESYDLTQEIFLRVYTMRDRKSTRLNSSHSQISY